MPTHDPTKAAKASRLSRLLSRMVRRTLPSGAAGSTPEDIAAIEASRRFDKQWYVTQYPDVAESGMDPVEHYVRHGAAEHRNPSRQFNTRFYLDQNPDVANSGINPFRHYLEHGIREGRRAIPPPAQKGTEEPLISVVIPVYQVEIYLSACLESVTSQTYRNLEIIVVDDGSPDHSYDIAEAYAQSDSRIKIVRRENGGLGSARNAGAAMATGTYLCFVDSDDTLPPDSIARMIESLCRSMSDFAVGAIRRLRYGKVMPPADWVNEVFAETKVGTTLDDFPTILKDVFSTNKLFYSEFYWRHVSPFPEGIRYEDREPSARAFLHGVFDVLTDTVYYWRVRDDGTSISQQKSSIADLHDRSVVQQRVSSIFAAADPAIHGAWLAKALGFDLRDYFEQVPRTDEAFFHELKEGMLPLASGMTPQLWQKVRMIDRLPALAVLAGCRDDVGVAIARREEYGYFVPSRIENGSAYLDRKYLEGMRVSLEDELLKLDNPDLLVVAEATSLWWQGTRLRLEGYAFLASVDFAKRGWAAARLVSRDRPPIELTLIRRNYPRADREAKDAWNDHAGSGFAIELDPVALDLDPDAAWRLEITVGCSGLAEGRSTMLHGADPRGILGTPAVAAMDGARRWMARFEPGTGFVLRCRAVDGVPVTAINTEAGLVTIATPAAGARSLLLKCESLRERMEVAGAVTGEGETEFRFRLPELPVGDDREHVWLMHFIGDGDPRRPSFAGDHDALEQMAPEYRRIRASVALDGTLRLIQTTWWAVVDSLQAGPDSITVNGRIDAPDAFSLSARLAGESQAFDADEVEFHRHAQRFQARIPFDPGLGAVDWMASAIPPATAANTARPRFSGDGRLPRRPAQPTMLHGFSLRLSVTTGQGHSERWLKVSTGLQHQLPTENLAARYRLALSRAPRSSALWVRFRPPYREDERGRLAQRRLHEEIFHPQRRNGEAGAELEEAVLFESFSGTQISDSGLAICKEIISRNLELKLYWTVADMGMSAPKGTTPLLIHSREWMLKLSHARYLVNNNCFPFYFRKQPGQVYLQTWHGTPLRRFGNDDPRSSYSPAHQLLMQRESTYWDFLLAQNDFAADVLPRALGYNGRVLNLGCPRNDSLTGSRALSRRRSARKHFGFTPNQYVVLYAPAWRPDVSGARGPRRVDYLDYETLHRTLGDDTRMLLRGDHNTAKNPATHAHGIIDATHYPNASDLILVADLLVTDYSSMMFDWVVTGKPIAFLVPDLGWYRRSTAGLYLDLEAIAPGPVCHTKDELRHVLGDLDATTKAYAERYAEFTKKFAPRDDGDAAVRVVDVLCDTHRERHPRR